MATYTPPPATAGRLRWRYRSGPGYTVPPLLAAGRDIRDRCAALRIPLFFKQVGGATSKAGGRQLDGRTWAQSPQAAQIAVSQAGTYVPALADTAEGARP